MELGFICGALIAIAAVLLIMTARKTGETYSRLKATIGTLTSAQGGDFNQGTALGDISADFDYAGAHVHIDTVIVARRKYMNIYMVRISTLKDGPESRSALLPIRLAMKREDLQRAVHSVVAGEEMQIP